MDSPGSSTRSPQLFDNAEWYLEQTRLLGMPADHTAHHMAYFLRWLDERGMTSDFFRKKSAEKLTATQAGQMSWPKLILDSWGGCLLPEMVTAEANNFGAAYFTHARGRFWDDYVLALATADRRQTLQETFSDAHYARLEPIFARRLAEWRTDPASAVKTLGARGKLGVGYLVLGTTLLVSGLAALVVSWIVQYFASARVAGLIRLGSFFAMVMGLAMFGLIFLFAYASRRRKALRKR